MDFEFDALKREFLAEAEQKISEITAILGGDVPQTKEQLERIVYLSHQLKGAGGSYGFSTISTEAAELERDVEKALDDATTFDGTLLTAHAERIAAVIDSSSKELAAKA